MNILSSYLTSAIHRPIRMLRIIFCTLLALQIIIITVLSSLKVICNCHHIHCHFRSVIMKLLSIDYRCRIRNCRGPACHLIEIGQGCLCEPHATFTIASVVILISINRLMWRASVIYFQMLYKLSIDIQTHCSILSQF